MKLIIHTFKLFTRKVFTTSHGSSSYRNSLVIELVEEDKRGYGEATEILYYGKDINNMIALVQKQATWIESLDLLPPAMQFHRWYERFGEDRFVLCALDMAYHDLWGKLKGKKLVDLWGLDISKNKLSSLTVGIDTIPNMLKHIDENPWPLYKIKLGTDHDMEIMKAIRAHTDKPLKVDANGGWNVKQTIEYSKVLKDLNVEYIEQPLTMDQVMHMDKLFENTALPLYADESCHTPADIDSCIGKFHGINIKLMKCGGLTPALEMIGLARQKNLQIMIGCMTETSIGISALGQILPFVDHADMDGSLLISNDPASGVYLDYGKAIYPDVNGTGAMLLERNEIG
ncbi:MAG: dipeptide epimerase [Saprospiraceae bacterium]|nr:dipeptide epimerase [Saprospiraceae bacterium]